MPAKHLVKSNNGDVLSVPVQAARVSADAVAAAVTLTNDCIKDGNAVEATSKAAASAWRSSQVSSLLLLLWQACLSYIPKSTLILLYEPPARASIQAFPRCPRTGLFSLRVLMCSKGTIHLNFYDGHQHSSMGSAQYIQRVLFCTAGCCSSLFCGGERTHGSQARRRGQHRRGPVCRSVCRSVLQPGALLTLL